jgi:hypothetical protein
MLIACIVCACNDRLDITQKYAFDLLYMPHVKRIMEGETAEIRCKIVREGNYENTEFYIRYFQPDGKGELRLDDGRLLIPNDSFILKKDVFRLYYTSRCTEQQTLDVYVEDSFGQIVQQTFEFSGEQAEKEKE